MAMFNIDLDFFLRITFVFDYGEGVSCMSFDYQLFQFVNGLAGRVPFFDQLMIMYTKYGLFLFGLLLMWIWFTKKEHENENRLAVLFTITAASMALLINHLVGDIYFRPRPFSDHLVTLLVNKSLDPSFPSDHSAGVFAIAFTFFWRKQRFRYGFLSLAILMGISRVYVGVHYPLDVVGGAITGFLGTFSVKWQSRNLSPIFKWIFGRSKKTDSGTLNRNMKL